MTYDYNNATAVGDTAFMDQFYVFTNSPTASTAAAASPSTSVPVPPVTMSSPASSQQEQQEQQQQQQAITWSIPLYTTTATTTAIANTAMQSPVEFPSSSPEDSPQSMSPGHLSSTASSPNQQLLSPFQTTMSPNSPEMPTEWSLRQNQTLLLHQQLRQQQFLQQQRQFQGQQSMQQQQQQRFHRHQQQPQQHHHQHHHHHHHQAPPPPAPQDLQPFVPNPAFLMDFNSLTAGFPSAPLNYLNPSPMTNAALETGMQIGTTFNGLPAVTSPGAINPAATNPDMQLSMANLQDLEIIFPPVTHGLPQTRLGSMASSGSTSPTGTSIEVHSLGSSSGEFEWSTVDLFSHYDHFSQPGAQQSIFNPGQTLHLRTNSDSSHSECNALDIGSYEDVQLAAPFSPLSQLSQGPDSPNNRVPLSSPHSHHHHHSHTSQEIVVSPTATVSPVPIKATSTAASSSRHSPSAGSGVGPTSSIASSTASLSSSSPPIRRTSGGTRRSPINKSGPKAVIRRSSSGKDGKAVPGEKKVGRRRGPLLPEQRKQASEIRKLRACLRCKFLKKTCDKGEPCAGCQPSHARLWQVPCTRIDIKDVNFFMKDWKADYERHLDLNKSIFNVKGFSKKESLMWITHGYGFCLPIAVREVQVVDDRCFQADWVESYLTDQEPINFGIRTEKLDVGEDGVSAEKISNYVDCHIDGPFEKFVDDHFEGTPFITQFLKTTHRFYMKEKLDVIRKALKLVLAYNLTMHITLVEQQGSEMPMEGQIDDEDSKFYGKVVAPVMINFQIKCAMAELWRQLLREILEELSSLYSRVYSGDRLKNWPTIFMLSGLLLIVWEEMQFDCHYHVQDKNSVQKFCNEMEGTPVGVIVGLFHAISQKLPNFTDWDTASHGSVLNNNEAVCEAMTDMRQHITQNETYLRSRQTHTEFNRHDFDCLSNKFLSKLVIRAN